MKVLHYIIFLTIFTLISISNVLSQEESGTKQDKTTKGIAFQFGYISPNGIPPDIIICGSYISSIDEYLNISLAVDFYRRRYSEEVPVAINSYPSGVLEKTTKQSVNYETVMLPVYLKLGIKFPLTGENRLFLFGSGGFGYAGLLNQEKNYNKNTFGRRFYQGFFKTFSSGIIFKLGTRSALVGDLFYNQSYVSRKKKGSSAWLPINDEVNLTGMGFRVGIWIGRL